MVFENLLITLDKAICFIVINRPDKLNALNKKTVFELGEAIHYANKDNAVRGIILTGAGSKAFAAGADIAEFLDLSVDEGKALSMAGHQVFKSIEQSAKPVIAAVNGFALGGGCELAMACHLRIASDQAHFGQPEVNLGLIAGYGGTQRLTQLVGKARSLEMHLTADRITASKALEWGLVNQVVPNDQLLPKTIELMEKILSKGPLAVAGVIASVNAFFDKGHDGFAFEIEEFGKCFGSEEVKEGTKAFLEKRKANFVAN